MISFMPDVVKMLRTDKVHSRHAHRPVALMARNGVVAWKKVWPNYVWLEWVKVWGFPGDHVWV
jgi:hypothetical protein